MSAIENKVLLILCELDVNHIPGSRDRLLRPILVNKADEKLFLAQSQLLVFWIGDIRIRAVPQVPWRG
ncbi:hypothetical protein [Oscillatoria sp. HE19RPO]|uniref:hypothetical protein n=1 Tax=Oscillatoria sp. HE19RPO TaxID=2954806 RepID=UPI0020C4BC32|nr:hypothetical protein [Oscillatoria sp. HE19RPO]